MFDCRGDVSEQIGVTTGTIAVPAGDPQAARHSGIAAGTPVLTRDGELPVEFLCAGDGIITRAGIRILRSITSQVSSESLSLRPAGQDARTAKRVVMGRDQQIHIRPAGSSALSNLLPATVTASRIADGEEFTAEAAPQRLFRLVFDRDEVIYAGGLELKVQAVN